MQAIRINEFVPSISFLRPESISLPRHPQPGEAVVEVHCAALNHVDLLYAQGKHQNNTTLIRPPFTLGLEFAGTIISLGGGTAPAAGGNDATESPFKVGDRVFGAGLGSYAERILVPIHSLRHLPRGWKFEDAAGLAATASVAYGAVAIRGAVKQGDWVFVHGAAGGIGVYACQIAKALGAKVICGVRRLDEVEKVSALKILNCVHGFVETGSEAAWEKDVLRITEQKGVDVVIDNVGLVARSIRCLRPLGGKIVLVGFAGRGGVMEQVSVNRILLKQAVIIGYRYGDTFRRDPDEIKAVWDGLMAMINAGSVKPVIFHRRYYGLRNARTAMEDLQERKIYGKAIIYVNKGEAEHKL